MPHLLVGLGECDETETPGLAGVLCVEDLRRANLAKPFKVPDGRCAAAAASAAVRRVVATGHRPQQPARPVPERRERQQQRERRALSRVPAHPFCAAARRIQLSACGISGGRNL